MSVNLVLHFKINLLFFSDFRREFKSSSISSILNSWLSPFAWDLQLYMSEEKIGQKQPLRGFPGSWWNPPHRGTCKVNMPWGRVLRALKHSNLVIASVWFKSIVAGTTCWELSLWWLMVWKSKSHPILKASHNILICSLYKTDVIWYSVTKSLLLFSSFILTYPI